MLSLFDKIIFDGTTITDISQKFVITNIATYNTKNIFFDHIINGWKAPEELAYDFYGSCDDVWLVLGINKVCNPATDWLLKDAEVRKLAIKKYGSANLGNTHHWEKDGIIYRNAITGGTAITNLDYENDRNEAKRKVKIIYPELVSTIKTEIKNYFNRA